MAEVDVFSTLISQAPGVAGVIIVVLLFLRAIEKRDLLFIDQMNKITERLAALENLMTQHDTASKARGDALESTLERVERKLGSRKASK